jgi:excinuclease ABC subunit B
VNAEVILYADQVTPSMQRAIDETERRRRMQMAYNEEHGIKPETVRKEIRRGLEAEISARKVAREAIRISEETFDRDQLIAMLEDEMLEAAKELEFERAAQLRDRIAKLREAPTLVTVGEAEPEPRAGKKSRAGNAKTSRKKRV